MSEWTKLIDFVLANQQELWTQVGQHLWLTLVSLFISTLVGLSLGIMISKEARTSGPVLGIVNAIQTVPSVALLGFLLPFFGIGVVPAIVALFLYGLLPIVRNTYSGITNVDPSVKEAAQGMGLSPAQVLTKVELPLAAPVIFAGIRTAFVINVGVATLCALIAAGGLGQFIFRGLSTNNIYMILAGAIPAGLMALFFDALLGLIQRHIYQLKKPLAGLGIAALAFIGYQWLSPAPASKILAGFPSEFVEREDGYPGLKEKYDLDLEIKEMEIGLMYQAVRNGNVDVISGFSTDGRIEAFDLFILEDDKHYFPPYHAAPLVRIQTLDQYPELATAFEQIAGNITGQEMSRMNYLVDEEHQDITKVARNFLAQKGLETSVARNGKPDIVIGSKNFTESFLLAEMFKLLIENYTSLAVELKLGFGGTKLLFDAMQEGFIDIYPEYTGTGLLVILKPGDAVLKDILYEKEVVLEYVRQHFRQEYQLQWLDPLGFNNTHALMMRQKDAERQGLTTISDLAGIDGGGF